MKTYISGPITGFLKDEVITAFSSAETKLKEKGCIPINPLNNGLPWNSSWEDHMKRDIQLLLDCDAIYLLDNYKQSKGALLELHIAEELGLTIMSENIFDSDTSLEDIIELPSRTLNQIMLDNMSSIIEVIKEIGEENSEGLRILRGITPDKPASNVITNNPYIHPSLLGVEESTRGCFHRVGNAGEPIP